MWKSDFETGPKRETGSHLKVPYPLPKAKKDTGFNGFSKLLFFKEKDNRKYDLLAVKTLNIVN